MWKAGKFGGTRRSVYPPRLVDRLLGSASRRQAALMLVLLCCLVAVIGTFVLRDLLAASDEAQQTYNGSVLGLQQIGELQFDTQETRRATLYALTTNDSNLQVEYADQSREADRRVSAAIANYGSHAYSPAEIALSRRLSRDWTAYLGVRDEVLASILEGSTGEAVALDLTGGVPAFERVRQDLSQIKRLYDADASRRLANLAASSRRSTWRIAGILGFTLLLSCAAVWAIQRNRMLSAISLARLQMEFVASVSHELRTPLAVLSSAADNLADGLIEGKDSLRTYGAILQKQSRRMGDLIDQILLFASTEDGTRRYALQPLELAPILHAVLAGAETQARAAGIAIERSIDAGLPLVLGDPAGIAQCVQNLLGNAIKYSGSDRQVWVRATHIQGAHSHDEEVRISIEDHGIGIEASDLEHIFEPFYRSPRVQAAQIPGTGLGLSLAKRIAAAMGAGLSAESEISQGSTFTLHLQIARMDNA